MEATTSSPSATTTLVQDPSPNGNGTAATLIPSDRGAALEKFKTLPSPHGKDERWRFSDIPPFLLDNDNPPLPLPIDDETRDRIIERTEDLGHSLGGHIFANAECLQEATVPNELRSQGLVWTSLENAATEHRQLFQRYFMDQGAPLGSEKFAALHSAMSGPGTFIYVPDHVEVELPLEAHYWLAGEGSAIYPHTLIVLGKFSKLTFLDTYSSWKDEESGFSCGVADLYLDEGAKLQYTCTQNWGSKVTGVQINTTQVEKDASATSLTVNLGASHVRHEAVSRMVGEGSHSEMLAISAAEQDQSYDMRTLQEHVKGNTTSDLLYKNSLNDQSKTIFSGLIKVDPGAHHTDAYQTVRNLVLDPRAEAVSMPGLEILADDVKCSHGATSGQIDKEEMFYMQARGIPADKAKRLVVFGFLNEVAQRLKHPEIEARIAKSIEDYYRNLR